MTETPKDSDRLVVFLRQHARVPPSPAPDLEAQIMTAAAYQNQISQRAQALRQAETELQGLIASNADSNQIRAKHNQVQSLRQQLAQIGFESMLEMREVLTPEQRRQLADRINQRRQHFRDRMMR